MQLDTLIIGATFSAISYALQTDEKTLIVEKTGLIGSEFVDSLNEKKGKKVDAVSYIGKRYLQELQARNLIDVDGYIYGTPSMFVLCDFLKKSGKPALFLTEIIQIEKDGGGFKITLFNVDGYSAVYAKKIIDTTSAGVLHRSVFKVQAQKYLNAIVYGETGSFGGEIITNPISGISIMRFPVDIGSGWQKARDDLVRHFKEARPLPDDLRISLIASTFAYDIEDNAKVTVDDNFWWVPSSRCYNQLEAFDRAL